MAIKFDQPLDKVPVSEARALKRVARSKFPNPRPAALTGYWINCDPKARSVPTIVISGRTKLRVEAWGSCSPKWCKWGPAKEAFAYSTGVCSPRAVAFTAFWDPGFAEKIMTGHLCNGCLSVEIFTRFKDGSRRYNYYSDLCYYEVDRATWLKKTRGKI